MATLVHQLTTPLRSADTVYTAQVWGEYRDDGLWHGWIEFVPSDSGPVLSTGQETSQGNLEALTYWARGLEPVYLEGAFVRAIDHLRAA